MHCFPLNGDDAWPVPSADNLDMNQYLKEMDEAGITQGCLLGRRSSTVWSGVESADIYELCQEYPGKFFGFGAVDVSDDIMTSLHHVDEAKNTYKFKGMVCEPGNSTTPCYADDRRLYPFYARCVELGLIVVISMSQFLGPNISYADPARVQTVCRDFPQGRFVIAHAAYPHVMGTIGACLAEKNLWIIPDVLLDQPENLRPRPVDRGRHLPARQKDPFRHGLSIPRPHPERAGNERSASAGKIL